MTGEPIPKFVERATRPFARLRDLLHRMFSQDILGKAFLRGKDDRVWRRKLGELPVGAAIGEESGGGEDGVGVG